MPNESSRNKLTGVFAWPWYLVGAVLYLPLWLTAGNPDLFSLGDVVQPAIVLLLITLVIAVVLRILLGAWRKAFLGAALGMVLLQCYAVIRLTLFPDLDPTIARASAVSIVVIASFIGCAVIGRMGGGGRNLSVAANIAAVVMLAGPLMTAVANQDEMFVDDRATSSELQTLLDAAGRASDSELPTIHHVVLDGYSRADVLREMYGFDNQPFIDQLENLGFQVIDHPVTPYGQTLLTMNAVFSMKYLNDDVAGLTGKPPKAVRQAMHGWFVDSPVRRALENARYSIVAIEGSYPPLSLRPATRVVAPPQDWTASTLLGRAVYAMTPLGGPIIHGLFGGRADTRESVRFGLADHAAGKEAQPALYYRHVLAPHPPFDLNKDGSVRETKATGFPDGDHWSPTLPPDERARQYRDGYLEKLQYVNARLVAMATALIDRTDGPVVIIFQGDHGGGMRLAHDNFDNTCVKERFSTFLGVYIDLGKPVDPMPDDFNLVNLYRWILSSAFGAPMPMLDDRSYFAPWNDPTGLVALDPERRDRFEENCQVISE